MRLWQLQAAAAKMDPRTAKPMLPTEKAMSIAVDIMEGIQEPE